MIFGTPRARELLDAQPAREVYFGAEQSVYVELEGAVNGVSDLPAANLGVQFAMAGNAVACSSALAGDLGVSRGLAGTIAAQSYLWLMSRMGNWVANGKFEYEHINGFTGGAGTDFHSWNVQTGVTSDIEYHDDVGVTLPTGANAAGIVQQTGRLNGWVSGGNDTDDNPDALIKCGFNAPLFVRFYYKMPDPGGDSTGWSVAPEYVNDAATYWGPVSPQVSLPYVSDWTLFEGLWFWDQVYYFGLTGVLFSGGWYSPTQDAYNHAALEVTLVQEWVGYNAPSEFSDGNSVGWMWCKAPMYDHSTGTAYESPAEEVVAVQLLGNISAVGTLAAQLNATWALEGAMAGQSALDGRATCAWALNGEIQAASGLVGAPGYPHTRYGKGAPLVYHPERNLGAMKDNSVQVASRGERTLDDNDTDTAKDARRVPKTKENW